MEKILYKYYEYDVTLWLNPSSNDDILRKEILEKLYYVNEKSNTNLSYGIFDKRKSFVDIKDMFKNIFVSILEIDNEPVAFSYQYRLPQVINSLPIIHQGLIMSYKNPGRDVSFVNLIASHFYFKNFGQFYTTSIAADPFIIGEISKHFKDVWPSPYSNNRIPPEKSFKEVAKLCYAEYVQNFFPFPESLSLNLKRFIIESKAKEMGFEVEMRNMVRDSDTLVNLFCMFWLDYQKQEIMLQVAKFDDSCSALILKKHPITSIQEIETQLQETT